MQLRNIVNFVYYSTTEENKEKPSQKPSDADQKTLEKILETLANQSMREKNISLKELDDILQNAINEPGNDPAQAASVDEPKHDDTKSVTKYLIEKGYLRDEKNWLTKKGFLAVGNQILRNLMNDLKTDEFGLHETKKIGSGTTVLDTSKKFEIGNDLKFLNVQNTILNTIQRISKNNPTLKFPLDIDVDDFEEFETVNDVRASVVYCIDLSSTMKSSLANSGMSRIEAAKRALWSLYILNNKFFPNDSVSVIGFASMASVIDPYDIPFLKTYDANDDFLHYTNYQAAFRLAKKILLKNAAQNKRIVLITDGQPSACFVDTEHQKNKILSEKPYSNFYVPSESLLSKIKQERNIKIHNDKNSLVYLCYKYKKVDPKVHEQTLAEAKKCRRENIDIDTIVISEETELLTYVQDLEKEFSGRTYHINQNNMDKVLVIDYLFNTKKILSSKNNWN
ncbi:VWA domain-containing protein [Candidatus Nitrosotenuis chungbukensis]|uniref:VWA domain-containing protein n=1 Tax=Candidatus Nitrosotenuis chungbukensis TaxID=1353246 RepID=UPI0009E0152C|nr:VWA domain-containing protein [Candidatus Nitrosotenuis chungbukensis]